jgi:RHS repeat-associated protein
LFAFRDDGRPIWAYKVPQDVPTDPILAPFYTQPAQEFAVANAAPQVYDLDGDGVAEVVFAAHSRIIILNGRTGVRKVDPYWTFNDSYHDVSALMLIDVNNDGHVDIVQNAPFFFNCLNPGVAPACAGLVGPVALSGGGSNNWLPGPKAFPNVQYRSTAIDSNARVLHDTKVSRVFRVPEQQGVVRDPRLAQATSFTYSASDGTVSSAPATVFIDIVPDNQPPVFTSTPPKSLWQHFDPNPPGGLVTHYYDVTAFDPDPGDTITFSLKSAPVWVSMSGPAQIRFEPTCGSFGNPCPWGWTTVIVTATDSRGASTDQVFIVNLTIISVTVPNVVGMSFDAAQTALIAQDLQGVKWAEVFGLQPAGTVLAQDAIAGAVVGRFDDIRLTVSKGPQPVSMPFVIGQQLAAANALLTGAGLRVNVSTTFSNTIPAGEVTAQSPVAGTLLLPATAPPVDLTVSAGGPLPAPIASIALEPGPGPALRLAGDELQYKAVAILTDGTSADVTLTSAWASSLTGVATINAAGLAKAIAVGATTISASLGGKTGQGTLNVASRVNGDNTLPTAEITSPADGGAVTGLTPIVGTASDTNFLRYELAIALAGDENYTVFAEGTTAVTNGTLGTLDPTMLVNSLYTLRLTVFDRDENVSIATRTAQVRGSLKIGLFTLAFQDLNVAASGLPLTITRTYDSRDKAQGDFGIGWRLGQQTLRLRTNRVLGTGWVRTVAGPVVSLAPTSEHKVSITMPDGKIEEFDMIVSPTSNFGSLDFTNVTGFQPRPGTLGQLQALANNSLLILDGGSEVELVDDSTLDTYSPKLYRYTTFDGTQFEVGPGAGVTKITDRNGNIVTFGPAGIRNSDGTGILFTRDAKGRIAAITDPSGNTQSYDYDGNGDLAQFTNAAGGVTKFTYDRSHNVLAYQGPDGNHGVRNEYDASGRLISTTDARGNKITFDHNPGASQEIVRNRLGYQLVIDYDATGRVLAQTNALGGVTRFTYDSQDNPLTETDSLGRVSSKTYDARNNVLTRKDFNGNTTTYTYNALGQQLTSTDPEGRLTTNVYDANGNLTQSSDAEGGTARFTYNAAGNLATSIDQLGLVTTYTYDGSGNKTSQTDPLGRTTTYTYDANNREVSNTDPTGKQVRTDYDVLGRVTSMLDKLGNRSSVTYSLVANGQRIASRIEPANRVTAFEYDVAGNLTKTTYPDGTFESASYDAENHPLTKTDRGGAVTQYEYDALGRETRKTLPDGAVTTRTYDGAGRVLNQTNERGNTITHAYAPNVETITDALGNVTVHTFDSNARRSKIADALGRATSFAYDGAGNLIKDTAPDGSSATTTFDAAKRKTAVTDRAGNTTQFAYDSAGQLISVTDAAGGITRYVYDPAGNRIAQTDASGRTTNMSYDAAGHLLSRTRPSARQETFAYDANGNQIVHTDFNGRTATMVYDPINRLVQKNLPGGVSVDYAYTPLGFRKKAGGDSNAYDQRGRMVSEVKASGETITYAYDLAGNKTSVVTSKGTTTYTYDAMERISKVVDGTGTTTYSYDAVGNLLATASPNGITATYSYDTLNRLVKVTNAQLSGVVSSYTYTVGPAGNRLQAVEAGSAAAQRTITYGYDSLYRLTNEVINEPGQPDQAIAYSYDAVGNRTQMNRNGVVTDYTYDIDDRLVTEVSAGTTTASSYDNNGNLASRSAGAVVESYGYDAENRMLTAVTPSGFVTFTYDADGMRTSRTAGGVITNFLLDKNRRDAQVLVETGGGATVVYNHGHQLISQIRPGGVASFYVADGQLSTRQLTDAAGTVTDRYTFDAFGRMLTSTGSTPNTYLYTGQQLDPNVGFYYLRARYYDPQRGRFVATDPEDGNIYDPMSLHRYLYAHANPTTLFDPSGREDFSLASVLAVTSVANTVFGAVTAGFTNIALKGAPIGFNKSRTFLTEVVVGGFNGFLAGKFPIIGPIVAGAISTLKDIVLTHYIERQDILWNDVIYSAITNIFIGGTIGVGLNGTSAAAIFSGAGAQNLFRLIGSGIAVLTGTSTSGLEEFLKKPLIGGTNKPFWCKKDYVPRFDDPPCN